ncbi:MAG: 16S rRNA (uracil(1498)-N(3))-methyltransferase [Gammaproteobacteria bacterium]|jgi:16S rRNA (uracil1498-N3)-methyltransferase
MRIPRIYQPIPLHIGDTISLDAQATNHVVRVLRLKQDDPVIVFNGQGGEYAGVIDAVSKRHATVRLQQFQQPDKESPLHICLFQGVSRGERMDFTMQKAVELGVNSIFPVHTQRSAVHINVERMTKKHAHWQGVVNSACEQCGRDVVPQVHEPATLQERAADIAAQENGVAFALDHRAEQSLTEVDKPNSCDVALVVGPEGGLTAQELDWLRELGCISVKMGPRILRTETAAVTAIAVMQSLWGDF